MCFSSKSLIDVENVFYSTTTTPVRWDPSVCTVYTTTTIYYRLGMLYLDFKFIIRSSRVTSLIYYNLNIVIVLSEHFPETPFYLLLHIEENNCDMNVKVPTRLNVWTCVHHILIPIKLFFMGRPTSNCKQLLSLITGSIAVTPYINKCFDNWTTFIQVTVSVHLILYFFFIFV